MAGQHGPSLVKGRRTCHVSPRRATAQGRNTIKAPAFDYARPDTVDAALALLAAHGDAARPIAGGQSLVPALNLRLVAPELLVDIARLDALRFIRSDASTLRLGALVRHADLLADPAIATAAPLLRAAAAHIAHPAIRTRGTIGGSLAHADPAAELPACCLALDATVLAQSTRGTRRIPAANFFQGLFTTALAPDELLVAVEIPIRNQPWGFAELARRSGDYALAGLAACAGRFAFFSVGPTPVLARHAAAALATGGIDSAVAALAHDLDPPGDLQATGATRLHWAGVLLRRVVADMNR